VVTREGRYERLGYVQDLECRSAARARAIAGGETSLSGQAGAESFRTVCGVIVGSRVYRYLCEVTDLKGADGGVERTAQRFPDNEPQLVWGEGDQVRVQFEGLVAPIPATYSLHVTFPLAPQQARISTSYFASPGSREISVNASALACATSILSKGSRWCIGRVR